MDKSSTAAGIVAGAVIVVSIFILFFSSSYPAFPLAVPPPVTITTGNSSSISFTSTYSSGSSSTLAYSSSTTSLKTTITKNSSSSTTPKTQNSTDDANITVYASRVPSPLWAPCFAKVCKAGEGPGATMLVGLFNSSGFLVGTGFTNENGYNFTGLAPHAYYYVHPDDCDYCHNAPHDVNFSHWANGNKTRLLKVLAGSVIDAWYIFVPLNVTCSQDMTTTTTSSSNFSSGKNSTSSSSIMVSCSSSSQSGYEPLQRGPLSFFGYTFVIISFLAASTMFAERFFVKRISRLEKAT